MRPIILLGEIRAGDAEAMIELYLTAPTVLLYRRMGVSLPSIGSSGIRYRREPDGEEIWRLPHVVLRDKYGDCEDLSLYLAVALRMKGVLARVKVRRNRGGGYHATVDAAGREIDPSKLLGM